MTSSNARHLPTLRRRKVEPVAAKCRKAFNIQGMRQKITACDRGRQQAGISGHASALIRRLRYPSAPMSRISCIFDLVTGNSDVPQRSVVDHLPGRSDTADLVLAAHSRPQPRKDRSDPCAPASEIGSHSLGTPGGGAISTRTAAAGVLARRREDTGPVRVTVDPVPRPAKTLEERVSPIVHRAEGSGDVFARPLTLKLHLISPIASADRGDRPNPALPRCFGVGEKGYD